ncbi:MAG: hypothetical protein ACYS67_15335 [Planctomycetota bacterium]|jgi:hypothetical protein
MDNNIGTDTKTELIRVLGIQYRKPPKMQKTQILDQLIAISGYPYPSSLVLCALDLQKAGFWRAVKL